MTGYFIVIITAIIIIYDVFIVIKSGVDATISRVLLNWSKQNPIIPFSLGVVCGHLFWSN